MRTLALITWASVLAVLSTLMISASASAHTASVYYDATHWPSSSNVRYGFETGYPTGAFRGRVLDGANQWTNRGGTTGEPDFAASLPDSGYGEPETPCNRAQGTGAIFRRNLDYLGPGVLGATRICYGDGIIATFSIEFDTDLPWYNGTDNAPPGTYDFWSVTSHEFGHVTGFYWGPNDDGHFLESDAVCPNTSYRHTMCPSIYDGTERQRTLGAHDAHTFTGAYSG